MLLGRLGRLRGTGPALRRWKLGKPGHHPTSSYPLPFRPPARGHDRQVCRSPLRGIERAAMYDTHADQANCTLKRCRSTAAPSTPSSATSRRVAARRPRDRPRLERDRPPRRGRPALGHRSRRAGMGILIGSQAIYRASSPRERARRRGKPGRRPSTTVLYRRASNSGPPPTRRRSSRTRRSSRCPSLLK